MRVGAKMDSELGVSGNRFMRQQIRSLCQLGWGWGPGRVPPLFAAGRLRRKCVRWVVGEGVLILVLVAASRCSLPAIEDCGGWRYSSGGESQERMFLILEMGFLKECRKGRRHQHAKPLASRLVSILWSRAMACGGSTSFTFA